MSLSISQSPKLSRAKIVLLTILTLLMLIGAAPGYIAGGKWAWFSAPEVPNMHQLRAIKGEGIPIPGWQTQPPQAPIPTEQQWHMQDVVQGEQKATVFLLPQTSLKHQPQVEWTDMEGRQRWQSDSYQTLNLAIDAPSQQFTTRFFRAWTKARTYAVVQWYAQPQGGNPVPSQWYIADRFAQWQRRRVPWVAVSIQISMAPFDDLSKYQGQAATIAKAVQTGLVTTTFKS
jgi:cyanoexosortase B-associated protein